jgi:hypothetical protein
LRSSLALSMSSLYPAPHSHDKANVSMIGSHTMATSS